MYLQFYTNLLQPTKFLKVADQHEAEALFLNSGPAEADYVENSGCLSLTLPDDKVAWSAVVS